jgi:hypothetical protein
LSALYIIENNLAGVLSESYGSCEQGLGSAGNAFYNSLWEQAAAQGITAVLSSGDGGSAGCDDFNNESVATGGLAVSGLASTPFNVSVGGTDFDEVNKWSTYWSAGNNATTGASVLGYIPEIPWNENCAQLGLTGCGSSAPNGSVNIVAGSGGQSTVYTKPKWQLGVAGMPNDNHRDQPDVSLFASPGFDGSGYIYCQGDQTISGAPTCDLTNAASAVLDFGIIGGTSASAPTFAGIMAIVNQYQAAHSGSARQGNANYVLYALAKTSGSSCTSSASEAAGCVFNDVVKGNSALTGALATISVPCQGGTPSCSMPLSTETGVLVDPSHTTTEAWTATAGYDMATGLGTINANNLATKWGSVSTVPTTTTLTLSPTTGITHGSAENVVVNVSVAAKSGTATGQVSLIATLPGPNGTSATQGLDDFTLANGKIVSATTNSLPGGTNTVSAHYAGDGVNAPSDSAPVTVSVGKESSKTFLVVPTYTWASGKLINGNANTVAYGSEVIIRTYITNASGVVSATGPPAPLCDVVNVVTCPTGTVTLTDNGNLLDQGTHGAGIYTLNNDGYTRNLASTLLAGTHQLAATYSGDNSYTGSSATDTVTVTPAPTTGQMLYYPSTVNLGNPFGMQFVVSTNVPGVAPTGQVTFMDGGSPLQLYSSGVNLTASPGVPPNSDSTLSAFVQGILTAAGAHTLTAQYSGDANYQPASSGPFNIQVLYPTNISQSESTNTITYGQSIAITVKVTSSGKSPAMAGQVIFNSVFAVQNQQTVAGVDANGNQTLTVTATTTPQGSEFISAFYSGDANYANSSTIGDFISVNIPDFSFSPNPGSITMAAGQPGTLQLNVSPASNVSSPVSLSCSGAPPGGYTCTVQPASVNLVTGASAPATLTVAPATGAAATPKIVKPKRAGIQWFPLERNTLWPASAISGLAALLTLLITPRRRYWRTSIGLGPVCLLFLAIGCSGGSGGGTGGGGGGGSGTTGPYSTTTTVSTGAAKIGSQSPVTFTAKVAGQGNPAGTVNFLLNGSYYGAVTLVGGMATLNTTVGLPGVYSLTAQYSGDTQNLSSTSAGVSQVVTGAEVLQITGQTGTLSHTVNVTVTLQ